MKHLKLTLPALIVISLTACHNPQKDSEAAVKKYIKAKVNDPASYEPVSFGKIDTVYTEFATSKECKMISKKIDSLRGWVSTRESELEADISEDKLKAITIPGYSTSAEYLESLKKRDDLIKMNGVNIDQEKVLTDTLTAKSKRFKKQADGYKLVHTFRAKNALGALVLDNYKITVNKDFEVTSAEPIEK